MKTLVVAALSVLIAVSLMPAPSSAQSGQALLDNQDVQAARENQDVQAPRVEMTPSGVSTHAPVAAGPSSSVSR